MSAETINENFRKMSDDWDDMWIDLLSKQKAPPKEKAKGGDKSKDLDSGSSGLQSKTE